MSPLGEYLDEYFGKYPSEATGLPYVRWYTQLRDVRFLWAAKAFERFAGNWTPPYFLPTSDYVLPFSPGRADPRHVHFPAKGLFISPKGGKTGLHVDPWGSDAVLCQLFGDKHWTMYHPDEARYLRNEAGVVDPDCPDHDRFPEFRKARATYDFVLRPRRDRAGAARLVPRGQGADRLDLADLELRAPLNLGRAAGVAQAADVGHRPERAAILLRPRGRRRRHARGDRGAACSRAAPGGTARGRDRRRVTAARQLIWNATRP
jgi:hypothetical protein